MSQRAAPKKTREISEEGASKSSFSEEAGLGARQFVKKDLSVDLSRDDPRYPNDLAINKLRLSRSLLEKWVEEPFFERAVVGCFVRLGVGKVPGLRSEPQYKVCEVVGVEEYKHSYALGEFQTKKALLLRIGRNQRLWRMNVISNHRFTTDELSEWRHTMITERQQLPSLSEIDKRKATMRKAVFGALVSTSATSSHLGRESKSALAGGTTKIDEKYSEADVARLVDARRKRSEAARFQERQTATVARLNHGQARTRYEHEVCAARDKYAALLIARGKELRCTPELLAAIAKVEQSDAFQNIMSEAFEHELDALALMLVNAQGEELPASTYRDTGDFRTARKLLCEARQKLDDLCKNALDMRNKHEIEVPSRTCTLHLINEAKKQENSLADMAYGERKLLDERHHHTDEKHAVFQRRATKPKLLWTVSRKDVELEAVRTTKEQTNTTSTPLKRPTSTGLTLSEEITKSQRQRNGMSLQEYIFKAKARENDN